MKLLSDDKLREMLMKAYQLGRKHKWKERIYCDKNGSIKTEALLKKQYIKRDEIFNQLIAESAQQ